MRRTQVGNECPALALAREFIAVDREHDETDAKMRDGHVDLRAKRDDLAERREELVAAVALVQARELGGARFQLWGAIVELDQLLGLARSPVDDNDHALSVERSVESIRRCLVSAIATIDQLAGSDEVQRRTMSIPSVSGKAKLSHAA
jgi:hypothetical protein